MFKFIPFTTCLISSAFVALCIFSGGHLLDSFIFGINAVTNIIMLLTERRLEA